MTLVLIKSKKKLHLKRYRDHGQCNKLKIQIFTKQKEFLKDLLTIKFTIDQAKI